MSSEVAGELELDGFDALSLALDSVVSVLPLCLSEPPTMVMGNGALSAALSVVVLTGRVSVGCFRRAPTPGRLA